MRSARTRFGVFVLVGATAAAQVANGAARRDIVGYWNIALSPGWNLVAFPVLPDDARPQAVLGDKLGAAVVCTWDRAMDAYRRAAFSPESGRWSGDLFRLDRGAAYWIYLPDDQPMRLTVVGHPEDDIKFRWSALGEGWRYYAPTYGKRQSPAELPPDEGTRYLFAWDAATQSFRMATAQEGQWRGDEPEGFLPDRAYAVYRQARPLREMRAGREAAGWASPRQDEAAPPWPVVAGNLQGTALCTPDGQPCAGALVVRVVREVPQPGPAGVQILRQVVSEQRQRISPEYPGRVEAALTVGWSPPYLNPGDRVYLEVTGTGGATARSASFEVPADRQFVWDVSFPDPLASPESAPQAPEKFALGAPRPNPFNAAFQVEVRVPHAGEVKWALVDLAGRRAAEGAWTLGAGVHRLTVAPQGLPSGVYWLQVRAGTARAVAKTALVK